MDDYEIIGHIDPETGEDVMLDKPEPAPDNPETMDKATAAAWLAARGIEFNPRFGVKRLRMLVADHLVGSSDGESS